MVPLTGSPEVCTETLVSLPPAAVTLMPPAGFTLLLPLAGVMASCTAGLGVVALVPGAGAVPPAAGAGPGALPPEQPASRPAATHRAAVTAATRTLPAFRTSGLLRPQLRRRPRRSARSASA